MEIFYSIATFLIGLGVLLYSVKALGESLEKTTGAKFRHTVAKLSNNRFGALGLGAGITILLQSSTASMAMFVALCNAGIIGLGQAVSVVLGVNIGASITHIVVLFGSVKVLQILALFLVVGAFVIVFSKSNKVKNIGKLLFSIGLLFLSVSLMSQGMSVINEKHLLDGFITSVSNPVLLILVFLLFTCLIQTSMGAMAVLITFIGAGILPLKLAVWAVMGINLGTSVSTMLVTIGGSTNAKRTGITHIMFNCIGTILFSILLVSLPITTWISKITTNTGLYVLICDFGFNTITALLLLPFVKYLTKLTQIIFKEPKKNKNDALLLSEEMLRTPNIALPQILNVMDNIYTILVEDFFKSIDYLIDKDEKLKRKITTDCAEVEKLDDKLESLILNLSAGVSEGDQKYLSKMLDFVHKSHTIIRKIDKILFYASRWDSKRPQFNKAEETYIKQMCDNIKISSQSALTAIKNMETLDEEQSQQLVVQALELDNNVDAIKNEIRAKVILNMKDVETKKEKFTTYSNIVNAIEDVSEVLTTITILATEKD